MAKFIKNIELSRNQPNKRKGFKILMFKIPIGIIPPIKIPVESIKIPAESIKIPAEGIKIQFSWYYDHWYFEQTRLVTCEI